jgi:hypothetical protein
MKQARHGLQIRAIEDGSAPLTNREEAGETGKIGEWFGLLRASQ